MEYASCALCGSTKSSAIYRTRDRNWNLPGEFSVVKCSVCNLVFLNPRPDLDEIGSYYPETFSLRAHHEQGLDHLKIQGSHWEKVISKRLAPLLNIKTAGRILDVGCGDCLALLYLKRLGWDVFGLEPRENAADLARSKFGIDVRSGYLESSGFEPGFFDAITLIHVFEHVHRPDAMARQLSQLLAPDGLALIETPNFDSLESRVFRDRWVAIDAPRHLYHFTPDTLRAMLENNNLRVLNVFHGSDPGLYKMGYSESLRQMASDFGIKKYPAKNVSNTNAPISTGPKVDSTARKLESLLFGATGSVANSLKLGGRITAIAQKK